MLVISIPTGETSGNCKINGEAKDFEIKESRYFNFRPAGSSEAWDSREIITTMAWRQWA